jgi:branched-subunit amino acid aminotransferase/4-amino-4-deoxychorismate lyase
VKGGYILVNGKFHRENEPLFSGLDLQRLGKGMKESFRAENNSILFAEENYSHLVNGLSAIGLHTPGDWDLPRFKQDVSRLLNKNHLFLASSVHIHFIQGTASTDYILSAEEITRGFYPLSEPGLMIDFYDDGIKSNTKLNSFEPSGRFLWIAAADSALSKAKHNLIVFNNKGNACECIASSFAYIKDNTVAFPSRVSGGYQPPLISKIIKCAKSSGFRALVKNDISREDLLSADELFIIDNSLGIQKVLGLDTRRFYSTKTTAIALKLKELAMKEAIQ